MGVTVGVWLGVGVLVSVAVMVGSGVLVGEIGVLVSGDLPSDELNKMLELARKYCFVSNTLAQGITVDYKVV